MSIKNRNQDTKNKRIAVDIENTIINIMPPFIDLLRKEHNIIMDEKELLREYNLNKTTGLDHDAIRELFKKVWEPPYSELMLLYSNSVPSVLEKISKNFSIDIITATEGNQKIIKKWLSDHEIKYDNIIFVKSAKDKVNYIFEIIIEDYPEVAKLALENNKKVILVDWLYNRNEPGLDGKQNFFRVKSWDEIPKIVYGKRYK